MTTDFKFKIGDRVKWAKPLRGKTEGAIDATARIDDNCYSFLGLNVWLEESELELIEEPHGD